MNIKIVVLAMSLVVATAWAADEGKYNAHFGPYVQPIDQIASIQVRDGYISLDPDDTRRLMEAEHNPGFDHNWYLAPAHDHTWSAVFEYEETGHVGDGDKIDSAAILDTLRQGNEAGNKERESRGWSPLKLIGWRVEPHYESDTKRLSWATELESNGHTVINYTTKILGRTGVITVILVSSPEQMDASIADLKQQLAGVQYASGQGYSEFRSGDKVAEYGLAGLIVGGAAAVAAKTGLLKYLLGALAAGGKAIVAVVVAAFAGLRAMFSSKKSK